MRTIAHLSDLHFGRVDGALLEPLVEAMQALQPDVVAVSGDLTQRARRSQFREARAFLDRLPRPQVVVPGNHDVPLYDVLRRFASPLSRYRRYIEPDLAPYVQDEEIAVLGINTARSLTFKNGRVNRAQLQALHARFDALDRKVYRVLVTHHPFELPDGVDAKERVGRAELALQAVAAAGVDLLLSGHLHRSHVATPVSATHSALVVHAGTASSTRGRGERNAFNVIRVGHRKVEVEVHEWDPRRGRFVTTRNDEHPRR